MIEPVGEHAYKIERDRIVAWLRDEDGHHGEEEWFWRKWFADDIENGDHLPDNRE